MSDNRWVEFVQLSGDEFLTSINRNRVLKISFHSEEDTALILNEGTFVLVKGTYDEVKKKLGAQNE